MKEGEFLTNHKHDRSTGCRFIILNTYEEQNTGSSRAAARFLTELISTFV